MKARRFSLMVTQQEFPGGGNAGVSVWRVRASVDLPDNTTRELLMKIIKQCSPHGVRMSYERSDARHVGRDTSALFAECRGGGKMQRAWNDLPDA